MPEVKKINKISKDLAIKRRMSRSFTNFVKENGIKFLSTGEQNNKQFLSFGDGEIGAQGNSV